MSWDDGTPINYSDLAVNVRDSDAPEIRINDLKSMLEWLLEREVDSEDGKYTFPSGETLDCRVRLINCTKCGGDIKRGQKYFRTKRGAHHDFDCSMTDEELARDLAGYVIRRVQKHLALDGAEIDMDHDTNNMRLLIADLRKQFFIEDTEDTSLMRICKHGKNTLYCELCNPQYIPKAQSSICTCGPQSSCAMHGDR